MIGAVVSAVVLLIIIGSGRAFQQKITIETYFNESVQGLDIGSKVKYRGVVIGEVTKISFTYVKYQQDKPMSERLRYVLVEAQLQPKLLGGRVATEITGPESMPAEVERGLRVRSAPQGITGTNYLEIDYVDPPPALLAGRLDPRLRLHPERAIDGDRAGQFGVGDHGAAAQARCRRHLRQPQHAAGDHQREDCRDRHPELVAARRPRAGQGRDHARQPRDQEAVRRSASRCWPRCAKPTPTSSGRSRIPALQKLPDDAAAAIARVRAIIDDPNLPKTVAHLSQTLGRLDRILGAGESDLTVTVENLRQITDNLRDLTEDAKRYPSRLIFGAPPPPPERVK